MAEGERVSRRSVLVAGGGVVALGLAGCTGDDAENDAPDDEIEGEFLDEEPDYGDWFDGVENYHRTLDRRGEAEVTVLNGAGRNGIQFEPAAVSIDPETTVIWEWTGSGGVHNVEHEDGEFESARKSGAGETFEHTFEAEGIYRYFCRPHRGLNQKGAVVVL